MYTQFIFTYIVCIINKLTRDHWEISRLSLNEPKASPKTVKIKTWKVKVEKITGFENEPSNFKSVEYCVNYYFLFLWNSQVTFLKCWQSHYVRLSLFYWHFWANIVMHICSVLQVCIITISSRSLILSSGSFISISGRPKRVKYRNTEASVI